MPALPNVVLIVFDTARADAFEPYGAPPGSTPAFADLARRGAAAEAVFSTACWTVPAHASMFTGLLPRASGISQVSSTGDLSPFRPVLEGHRDRLLSEVLRRAGYSTRAVSTNLWLTEASGFATGFEEFVNVETRRQAALDLSGLRTRLRWDLEAVRARADDGAVQAGEILGRWIEEPSERPFFWFVNLIECHSPYLPPHPYNPLGPLDRWRAGDDALRHLSMNAIWRACAGRLGAPAEALERMRALYRGAIRLMDDWLARLLERLESAGSLDDTLVIVLSDHGENFGEGGLMGHAFSLDDRLIRIPLACAGPGAETVAGARSIAAIPSLIAEAVGMADHPWADGIPSDRVAVAQFDPPTGPEHPNVKVALDSWGLGPEAAPQFTSWLTCATDGNLKLSRVDDEEQLYDLSQDPLELHPRPAETADPGALAELRAALEHPAAGAVAAKPRVEGEADEMSAEERGQLEERMRLLGYL